MNLTELSRAVEQLLVSRNLRDMATLQTELEPGYCLRAAQTLGDARTVIIGTGFPVEATFETDGPLGAIALYRALSELGVDCHMACADPLASRLGDDFRVLKLEAFDVRSGKEEAQRNLARLQPDAVVSIERPGLAADQRYYNMRGEDISERCAVFDYYLSLAQCPSIAVGDGGNEIGMGKLSRQVAALSIVGAATSCDELIVADVSNWGAYALVGLLEAIHGEALLAKVTHTQTLAYLSALGSVDGVTRENTLTEDGLPAADGKALLQAIDDLLTAYRENSITGHAANSGAMLDPRGLLDEETG
ncbi:MAG: glutamate cyclase domain-containing protein [Congregibacter sp.]